MLTLYPGTVLNTLHIMSYINPITILCGTTIINNILQIDKLKYREVNNCPGSQLLQVAEKGYKPEFIQF